MAKSNFDPKILHRKRSRKISLSKAKWTILLIWNKNITSPCLPVFILLQYCQFFPLSGIPVFPFPPSWYISVFALFTILISSISDISPISISAIWLSSAQAYLSLPWSPWQPLSHFPNTLIFKIPYFSRCTIVNNKCRWQEKWSACYLY